jgi:phage repressor protein C with HTH and peptisase S24 domain
MEIFHSRNLFMQPCDRIKQLREANDLSQLKFGNILGFELHKIRDIERGKQKVTLEIAMAIEENFPVTHKWIMTGEEEGILPQLKKTNHEYVLLPKYNAVPDMGKPHDAPDVEYIESFHTFSKDLIVNTLRSSVESLALVAVDGDSMEPTLSAGDIVVIDVSKNYVAGSGIYAISIDNQPLVKRIHRLSNGDIKVISDNSAYQRYDETYNSDSIKPLRIAGRVVWKSGRVL